MPLALIQNDETASCSNRLNKFACALQSLTTRHRFNLLKRRLNPLDQLFGPILFWISRRQQSYLRQNLKEQIAIVLIDPLWTRVFSSPPQGAQDGIFQV